MNISSSTTTSQGIYDFKQNAKFLIISHPRLNSNKTWYITTSIIDIIFYFYPKMNGYKFTWKIQESDDEPTSIDSDPFKICLANKLFQRLRACKGNINNNNPLHQQISSPQLNLYRHHHAQFQMQQTIKNNNNSSNQTSY